MKAIDIINPVFRILLEQDMHKIDLETRKATQDGWYPVGGTAKKDRDWVQVLVKEKEG